MLLWNEKSFVIEHPSIFGFGFEINILSPFSCLLDRNDIIGICIIQKSILAWTDAVLLHYDDNVISYSINLISDLIPRNMSNT